MSERPAGRESEPGPSGRGSGRQHVDSPSGPAEGQERGARDGLQDDRITLVGLLTESYTALRTELDRDLARDADLPLLWFELLIRLARSPGHRLRMSDLAAQTSLTPSGLTRAIDRLEAAGLVERLPCPSDRRGGLPPPPPPGLGRNRAPRRPPPGHAGRVFPPPP